MDKDDEFRSPWTPLSRVLESPRRLFGGSRNGGDRGRSTAGDSAGSSEYVIYRNGARLEDPGSLDAAYREARSADDGVLWLDLFRPQPEELNALATRFDLHPLAVEDAIHARQRPKIEAYGETLFAVVKAATYVDPKEVIEVGEIMLFVGPNFVITVRHSRNNLLEDVRNELAGRPDIVAGGPAAIMWAVLDRIVDDYAAALDGLAEDVEQIEAAVFDPRSISPTERIYNLKREVMEFRRAADPLIEALEPVVQGEVGIIDAATHAYFRDVQDHAIRVSGHLASFDQLLDGVLQANVALISLQQNQDMRKITAWAAILAVVTSIAGIYGMNFHDMPELSWAWGYYFTLGLMALLSVLLYALFRRRHWL